VIDIIATPYKSIEVTTEEGDIQTISESNKITFITEANSEVKTGIVTGFKGTKPEKVKVEMIPVGEGHTEIWGIIDMVEGSLKLVEDNSEEDEDNE